MTVSLASIAATAESATSVAADYPASIAAGDLLLYFVASKFDTSSHAVPSGFALLDSDTAGFGAELGSDTGSLVASVFSKIASGSESGTEACAITSGNVAQGFIARLTRSGGSGFDIATSTARWTTNSTNPIDVTFDDAISFAVDDVVLVFFGGNTNSTTNFTSPSMTATGITFDSTAGTQRFTSTSLSGDMCVALSLATVTAGSGSATPSYTATQNTAQGEGPLILVRIRETAASSAPTLSDLQAVSVTATTVQATYDYAF